MNWKDIKKIIKEELKEATEAKFIVVGSKGEKGPFQYGPSYDSKEKAQAVADKKNKQSKYKGAGISFSVEKESLKEAEVTAGNTKFNLRMGVNRNKTKLGIKIQFEPKGDPLSPDINDKLEVVLQEKLNEGLSKYKMQVNKDPDVPFRTRVDGSQIKPIAFWIPMAQIKGLIMEALEQGDAPIPDAPAAPEPEGDTIEDEEIEEMIRGEMLNEMRIRDLNEASKIVSKEDFYEFINKGNNIVRDMEEAGKTINEAKKYLQYLVKHNIM